MNQEIEIEFKNLVTKEEFNTIVQFFSIPEHKFKEQINHYFDTPNYDLKEKKTALRIREKEGKYTLTLKQPLDQGLLETHQTLSNQEAKDLIEKGIFPPGDIEILIKLQKVNPSHIHFFGTLVTRRVEVDYKQGIFMIDHSTYLGEEDYELEYEVTNEKEGKIIFLQFLRSFSIPVRKTDNKVKRFYDRKHALS